MTSAALTLSDWMTRITKAKTRKEMFSILDEFRVLEWTDEERSVMAKHYIRFVDNIASGETATDNKTSGEAQNANAPGEDGPVWYEKM